jgi:hypothetical protein
MSLDYGASNISSEEIKEAELTGINKKEIKRAKYLQRGKIRRKKAVKLLKTSLKTIDKELQPKTSKKKKKSRKTYEFFDINPNQDYLEWF